MIEAVRRNEAAVYGCFFIALATAHAHVILSLNDVHSLCEVRDA